MSVCGVITRSGNGIWRHQMETFSVLLTLCAGNSPVTGEFPAQRPMKRSFDVFFDLRLNKRLSKNREAGDLRRRGAHFDVIVCNGLSPIRRQSVTWTNGPTYFDYIRISITKMISRKSHILTVRRLFYLLQQDGYISWNRGIVCQIVLLHLITIAVCHWHNSNYSCFYFCILA